MMSLANDTTNNTIHPSHCVPWIVVTIIECLAIVILNIITLIVFATQRFVHRRGTYLMMRNLAIADLLAGGISGPLQVERSGKLCGMWEPKSDEWLVVLLKQSSLHLFSMASLAILTAISLERMYSILYPFKHRVMKIRAYKIIICSTWGIAGAREMVQFALFKVLDNKNVLIDTILYIPYYCISFCIIFVSYVIIFIQVKCILSVNEGGNTASVRERKLTSTLFIATISSLLSLLPAVVYVTTNSYLLKFEASKKASHFHIRSTVVFLFLANSLVNPLIYSMRMKGFRVGSLLSTFKRSGVDNAIQLAAIPLDPPARND